MCHAYAPIVLGTKLSQNSVAEYNHSLFLYSSAAWTGPGRDHSSVHQWGWLCWDRRSRPGWPRPQGCQVGCLVAAGLGLSWCCTLGSHCVSTCLSSALGWASHSTKEEDGRISLSVGSKLAMHDLQSILWFRASHRAG